MNAKSLINLATVAALAVFGAQIAHQIAGSQEGFTGLAAKLAGGMGGVALARKLG